MEKSTPYVGNILVPVQVVELKFSEKEDLSLNPFQLLVLEAIEDSCSVEEIAQATLLTSHAIKTEISQLVAQKLLKAQDELVELTELSRKILSVSRCVQLLNGEKKLACINLMTGDVQEYDEKRFVRCGDVSALKLQPRIRRQEIDGIGMEENIEFFKTYLRTVDDLEDEDTDAILSAIYVELLDTGERLFQMKPISRLPCLIAEEMADGSESVDLCVSGSMCQIQLSAKLELPGMDDGFLSYLPMLADAGFLSEKGMLVAKAFEECQHRDIMTVYYDCVSGCWQFDPPQYDNIHHDSNKRKGNRVDLELPILRKLTEDVRRKIQECAHEHFELPRELTLEIRDVIDMPYIVKGILWEKEDV